MSALLKLIAIGTIAAATGVSASFTQGETVDSAIQAHSGAKMDLAAAPQADLLKMMTAMQPFGGKGMPTTPEEYEAYVKEMTAAMKPQMEAIRQQIAEQTEKLRNPDSKMLNEQLDQQIESLKNQRDAIKKALDNPESKAEIPEEMVLKLKDELKETSLEVNRLEAASKNPLQKQQVLDTIQKKDRTMAELMSEMQQVTDTMEKLQEAVTDVAVGDEANATPEEVEQKMKNVEEETKRSLAKVLKSVSHTVREANANMSERELKKQAEKMQDADKLFPGMGAMMEKLMGGNELSIEDMEEAMQEMQAAQEERMAELMQKNPEVLKLAFPGEEAFEALTQEGAEQETEEGRVEEVGAGAEADAEPKEE